MEEAMSHTAHSQYGTDDKVKLPNLTEEEVDWQGLEDLYSINESLYEYRPNYGPSPDDWVTFQKDIDHMFALRHILNKLNRTHTLVDDHSLAELGSGAGGGGLEEGSGGEAWPTVKDAWPGPVRPNQASAAADRTTPAPSTPHPATPRPTPTSERRLESAANDLPERPVGRLGASSATPAPRKRGAAAARGDTWTRQLEEMDGEEGDFSGNGMTELETRHGGVLRALQLLLPEPGPHPSLEAEDDQDIFQSQGYLPLSPQTRRPEVPASADTHTQTRTPPSAGVTLPSTLDYEGSGSQPQPSNQNL